MYKRILFMALSYGSIFKFLQQGYYVMFVSKIITKSNPFVNFIYQNRDLRIMSHFLNLFGLFKRFSNHDMGGSYGVLFLLSPSNKKKLCLFLFN